MMLKPLYKCKVRFLLYTMALFLSSCSTAIGSRQEYISAYQAGNLPYAENALTKTISKEIPVNNYQSSNDAVWLLLDRATTRFIMNDIEGSIDDFRLAVEALDYYNQGSPSESLSKVLLQDELGAYACDDFEQVLARVYFALALFQNGDDNNAFALLRQAEEVQQKKKEIYKTDRLAEYYTLVENPLAKYIMALFLEKRGDISNAEILYRQASALNGCEYSLNAGRDQATVLVIGHNGNAPYKVSGTTDASVASAAALEILLACHNIDPAYSSLTGIPIPILLQKYGSNPVPLCVFLDKEKKDLIPFYDITSTAYDQLEKQMPLIAARGVARFLIRRSAVAYAQKQDPCLGTFVDIAVLIANANTKADTRSWSTLPARIDLARFDLEPGCHTFSMECAPPFLNKYSLQLKAGDLCIINIFHIHPGVVAVQVPQHFVIN